MSFRSSSTARCSCAHANREESFLLWLERLDDAKRDDVIQFLCSDEGLSLFHAGLSSSSESVPLLFTKCLSALLLVPAHPKRFRFRAVNINSALLGQLRASILQYRDHVTEECLQIAVAALDSGLSVSVALDCP